MTECGVHFSYPCRYREGEVVLDRRRVIGLLELTDPATLGWRLHQVRVGEGDAGCGVVAPGR